MKIPVKQVSEGERRASAPIARPNVKSGTVQNEGLVGSTAAPDALVGALPTFDVMPANSGIFTFSQDYDYDGIEAPIPSPATVFSVLLPDGYVSNVQWFRCNVIDVGGGEGIPLDSFLISLYLDGAAEVFNQNISVSPLDGFFPCRIIGEGGQRVTITATFPYAGDYTQIQVNTTLTGQMLVKNRQQPQNAPLVQPQIRVQGN